METGVGNAGVASTMILDYLRCPWMSLDLLQSWRKAKPPASTDSELQPCRPV